MGPRRAIGLTGGLVVVAAIVVVLIMGLPRGQSPTAGGPATPSATQTPAMSTEPTGSPSPPPPSKRPPKPTATPDVVAFTNPNGPDPAPFPPDGYPFLEIARELPTYAQLWIDDNQRDVHLAVTEDIEGAIEAIRDGVPRGVTVYLELTQYTEAELCAIQDQLFKDRDELRRHGIVYMGSGCGNAEMRVNVTLTPFTPEVVAYMREQYQGPIDYEGTIASVGLRDFEAPEPKQVVLNAIADDEGLGLSTCGRKPFPEDALDGPGVQLEGDAPELVALRESLDVYERLYGDLRQLDWKLVEKDAYGATFIADRGDTLLEEIVFASQDGWVPGTMGYCDPRPLADDDSFKLEVFYDPDFPRPNSDSTELHLMVSETGCHGFSSPFSRMLPPTVNFDQEEVKLSVRARYLGGPATCPGTPPFPVTIVLPEPLGDRTLTGINGGDPTF